jgi:hypothetical protein
MATDLSAIPLSATVAYGAENVRPAPAGKKNIALGWAYEYPHRYVKQEPVGGFGGVAPLDVRVKNC